MSQKLKYGYRGRPEYKISRVAGVSPDHLLSKPEVKTVMKPEAKVLLQGSIPSQKKMLYQGSRKDLKISQFRKSSWARRADMKNLGLDIGTKHIVMSYREGNEIKYRHEINGYLVFDKVDHFLEQLLVKQGVPYVMRGKEVVAIGAKAEQLAYVMNRTLRRPMAEGGINKNDEDAQEIVAIIIKSIIGKLQDDCTLYYCTTAKPINNDSINIEFHKKVVKLIIESYVQENESINAFHINEARCLVIEEQGCAIGISWGAGTITVHAGVFGVPIFEFCVVGAGDSVDIETARRFGYDPSKPDMPSRETPTSVCRRKEKIDLSKSYDDKVSQAICLMYEILVENIVTGIIDGFNANRDKFKFDQPIPIINAGGTAMPAGFVDLFKKKLEERKSDIAIPIGDIRIAQDPLFAVARGCLLAAEMHK
jgi:hypothetical protein